jgi:tRNA (Thr-GGU) A37 N-methylase
MSVGDFMEMRFKPIGVIHTKGSDNEVREKGVQVGELEICPEFQEGLKGIGPWCG